MTNLFDAVATFNRAAGVRLLDLPGWVPDDELALALRLIDEEATELADAIQARDLIETADAIGDLLYVTAGLVLRIGGRRLVGSTDFLRDITHRVPSWDVYDDRLARPAINVPAEVEMLRSAVDRREHALTCAYARQLMSTLALLSGVLALPMRSVFSEIQRSNLAKLVDGKVIRDEGGKIRKPADWTPPDIAGVLARHGWKEAA